MERKVTISWEDMQTILRKSDAIIDDETIKEINLQHPKEIVVTVKMVAKR